MLHAVYNLFALQDVYFRNIYSLRQSDDKLILILETAFIGVVYTL